MGENLITCSASGLTSLHSGFSDTVIDTVDPPGSTHRGVGWDGTNVISLDLGGNLLNLLTEFTDTVQSSIGVAAFQSPSGCGWDGTNALFTDRSLDTHRRYVEFTDTVDISFASEAGSPYDAEWTVNSELLTCDSDVDDLILYDSFTDTVANSFSRARNNPTGVTHDGGTTYFSCDQAKFQQHDTFSSDVDDSFFFSSTNFGLAWEGRFASAATALRDMIMRGGVIPFLR